MKAGRRWRIVLGMSAVLAIAGGGWLGATALPVGVGHKAKTLCSGVFVSRLACTRFCRAWRPTT